MQDVTESFEIKALKREIANLKRKLTTRQTGESLIAEAVKEAFERPMSLKAPPAPARQRKKRHEIAVIQVSDMQLGKETTSYNTEVAELRWMELVDRVIETTEIRRGAATINECRVYLLGDMIEGATIFPHQPQTIDQCVFDQVMVSAPSIIGRGIITLLSYFNKVKIVCVPGNHGRVGSKNSSNHPKTNWDNVLYYVLKVALLGTPFKPHHDLARRLEGLGMDRCYSRAMGLLVVWPLPSACYGNFES
jgi:hypothetical protein